MGADLVPFRDAENAAAISRYGLEMERHDRVSGKVPPIVFFGEFNTQY
jgi:hypothetical protein